MKVSPTTELEIARQQWLEAQADLREANDCMGRAEDRMRKAEDRWNAALLAYDKHYGVRE
jgi:hypothetical protein